MKYQRLQTTKLIQWLWILLVLVNGFAPASPKPGPRSCSELEGLGVPVLHPRHTQGMEGSCCSALCEGCHLLGKEPEFTFVCELCSVTTLITAMQATKGIGNALFGVRSFLTSFSVVYKICTSVVTPTVQTVYSKTERSFSFPPSSGQLWRALAIPEQVILLMLY